MLENFIDGRFLS